MKIVAILSGHAKPKVKCIVDKYVEVTVLRQSDLKYVALIFGIVLILNGVSLITKPHPDIFAAAYDMLGGVASIAVGAVVALVAIGGKDVVDKLLDFLRDLFHL